MRERRQARSTLSRAVTYREIGEFWDAHDLGDYWEQTRPAKIEVALESEVTYYALESKLARQEEQLARRQGVSPETLLNLWVQEKLHEQQK